jgi:hypothetical protein
MMIEFKIFFVSMNSPKAIVRNVFTARFAFGGQFSFH